jgi:3-hydroxybutyrate dehydrogenase
MVLTLAGKLALVTGSTSGIGLGIAQTLARNGANVIINGFGKKDEIDDALHSLVSKYSVKADYHGADLSNVSQIESLMSAYPNIDILVNNAGIQHVAPCETFPVEKWNAIIDINLSAVFHTTRLALPYMKSNNWGRIINIASVHGLVASAEKTAYVAAKHGVIGLTKAVALETARTGVTCNAICPGWVLTPLVKKQIEDRAKASGQSFDEAKLKLLAEKQPSGGFVTPEQIGELASFMCSSAGSEVRGVAWAMDGAWTAQ